MNENDDIYDFIESKMISVACAGKCWWDDEKLPPFSHVIHRQECEKKHPDAFLYDGYRNDHEMNMMNRKGYLISSETHCKFEVSDPCF